MLPALALHAYNLNHLQFFIMGKIIVSKYGHLMLPVVFPHKVTPDILVVKILLWLLVIYKSLQINFGMNTYARSYVLFLDPVK